MAQVIGLDIGSLTTKIVLLENNQIRAYKIIRSSHNFQSVGSHLYHGFLEEQKLAPSDISNLVLTGYGRRSLKTISQNIITEIMAHAKGVQHYFPLVNSIIDIGGQDSKVIKVDPITKKVIDFQMNDKCAAGTGRFLEVMAQSLNVEIADLGHVALQSVHPELISSMCTVFAESEVIGLFAQGKPKEDIAAGIHESIAKRVGNMAKRILVHEPLVFSGGVALNAAAKKALEQELHMKIEVPPNPQIMGALGAALVAEDQLRS